jgi:DNA replication and repair protein RecF
MALLSLQVERFRCLGHVGLTFDPQYNLFIGPNASGKTSLLEALFFLGRGRSFRTRRLDRLIQAGGSDFTLVGRVRSGVGDTVLGVRGTRSATEIRVGGAAAAGAGELAQHFPPQVIDPEIHKLFEEGPGRRRRFLDWGVFHVEPGFMSAWQRYHRALRQRNAALRLNHARELAAPWSTELVAAGEELTSMRSRYLELLATPLAEIGAALLGFEVTLDSQRGWPAELGLRDALAQAWDRDLRLGMTHVGPHRADVVARVQGVPARERVSRGQQKLLAAALTLAQLRVQEHTGPDRSALLLDDPGAELDAANLERLLALVRTLPVQLFVTSLREDVNSLGTPGRVFHVEQGTVRPA